MSERDSYSKDYFAGVFLLIILAAWIWVVWKTVNYVLSWF